MYVTAPNNSSLDVSAINKIVSYDNDGRMSIGAGTTITTDVYEDHLERKYLKAAPVSDNIIVVASEGTVEVFLMNGDKTTSQTVFSSLGSPTSIVQALKGHQARRHDYLQRQRRSHPHELYCDSSDCSC